MTSGSHPRVAIFASFSGQGGVERMLANLARGLLALGHPVDLVLARSQGVHLSAIPEGVRLVDLKARHTFTSLPGLARYLRRERPAALLAAKDRAIRTAILARAISHTRVRLVGRLGTTVSAALEGRGALSRTWWYLGMRLFLPRADGLVAVSDGVARDLVRITGLPSSRIRVVRNPVVTPDLPERASRPSGHPWLDGDGPPVVMGAGRLTRQKDFTTLIRAFARVRANRPCRLVIAGEGRDRPALQALARELGIAADVALPGFIPNLPAFLSRASVFVLSSLWEGSPNVLTEALALGRPVVATDCPSGPREVLDEGRVAPLVPMGNPVALAAAMGEMLDHPPPADLLRAAVRGYTLDQSTRGYLEALGFHPGQ